MIFCISRIFTVNKLTRPETFCLWVLLLMGHHLCTVNRSTDWFCCHYSLTFHWKLNLDMPLLYRNRWLTLTYKNFIEFFAYSRGRGDVETLKQWNRCMCQQENQIIFETNTKQKINLKKRTLGLNLSSSTNVIFQTNIYLQSMYALRYIVYTQSSMAYIHFSCCIHSFIQFIQTSAINVCKRKYTMYFVEQKKKGRSGNEKGMRSIILGKYLRNV